MSGSFRRYEVLLPLWFNDGQPVPDDLSRRRHFARIGAAVRGRVVRDADDPQPLVWRHEGESYRDDLIRVFVNVADEAEHRRFFLEFKERLKARFQQIDVWITTYVIEVL
jgi:hypothetical protein